MQKVLTAAQMREVDRLTTERYGIPSIILMENAAHAVARVITKKLGGSVKGKSVLILCGKGNNGGDGAAVARLLADSGAYVYVILYGKLDDAKGDARINFELISKNGDSKGRFIRFFEAPEICDVWEQVNNVPSADLECIVDAVFGTGLTRFDDAINEVLYSHSDSLHLAVDVPTGIAADETSVEKLQYKADVTVTFTAPKPGNILPPAAHYNGELLVVDIGSPDELIAEQSSQLYLAEQDDAAKWLTQTEFSNDSYKNKRGHALLIAGSRNYTGAAVLAGDAAIRSGCGLVTLAVPESSRESVVARVQPEVMVRGISETSAGSVAETAVDEVSGFLKNVDAVAIGSGMSTNKKTAAFITRMVEERTLPMVVDADGLTAFSPFVASAPAASGGAGRSPAIQSQLILTPHEGEFRKLLGVKKSEADEILKDRVTAVRNFATKHNVILVLKGERVLIGAPDGRVIVNPTGNSGLGKAGNGDTLTGILAGFVAQAVQMRIDIVETVVAACYVAGMAGDIAEKKYGKRVMTASDVRECLVEVFDSLEAK